MGDEHMKVADEVWVITALLHSENPTRSDFSLKEIRARAKKEPWGAALRPGFMQHASYHCIGNKAPNNANHKMLFETTRGRRRLFRNGDTCHMERTNGRLKPNEGDLLPQYRHLLNWYEQTYMQTSIPTATVEDVKVPHRFPASTSDGSSKEFDDICSTTAFIGPGGRVAIPASLQQELGLQEGACVSIFREDDRIVLMPITEHFIRQLRGSLKGYNLQEDREREHRIEKQR